MIRILLRIRGKCSQKIAIPLRKLFIRLIYTNVADDTNTFSSYKACRAPPPAAIDAAASSHAGVVGVGVVHGRVAGGVGGPLLLLLGHRTAEDRLRALPRQLYTSEEEQSGIRNEVYD
jgi:hypothetical protein